MDRPIPTYEEVLYISLFLNFASVALAVAAGVLIRRYGRNAAGLIAATIWLSFWAALLALSGDVMFSILRKLEAMS